MNCQLANGNYSGILVYNQNPFRKHVCNPKCSYSKENIPIRNNGNSRQYVRPGLKGCKKRKKKKKEKKELM